MTESIKIALSKGRILEESLPLLARAGIEPVENPLKSRKLIIDTNIPGTQIVIIRAADVPTYVQFGAADLASPGATCSWRSMAMICTSCSTSRSRAAG